MDGYLLFITIQPHKGGKGEALFITLLSIGASLNALVVAIVLGDQKMRHDSMFLLLANMVYPMSIA